MVKELIEYYWNEQTETAEFLYEVDAPCNHKACEPEERFVVETRSAPLKVEPNLETYMAQLDRWHRDERNT